MFTIKEWIDTNLEIEMKYLPFIAEYVYDVFMSYMDYFSDKIEIIVDPEY